MSASKLVWQDGRQTATADFSIPHIGQLKLEVYSAFPGDSRKRTTEECHELAIRHARLLVRNLANELDRISFAPMTYPGSVAQSDESSEHCAVA